jgi:hypothetical protein
VKYDFRYEAFEGKLLASISIEDDECWYGEVTIPVPEDEKPLDTLRRFFQNCAVLSEMLTEHPTITVDVDDGNTPEA